MPTVFGRLGDQLYQALYEPEADKRRAALDMWVNHAAGVIASSIRDELVTYLAQLMEGRWTEEGWKRGEQKWQSIQPRYHLVMDIKLRQVSKGEQPPPNIIDASEPLVLGSDRMTRDVLFKQSALVKEKQGSKDNEAWDDGDNGERSDRSPNDDRSDSMNPNNDAYQAAMDNHANQLNPNNDAYWSSRGR